MSSVASRPQPFGSSTPSRYTVCVVATVPSVKRSEGSTNEKEKTEVRLDIPVTNRTCVVSLLREVAEQVLPNIPLQEDVDVASSSVSASRLPPVVIGALFHHGKELPPEMSLGALPPNAVLHFYYGRALRALNGVGCALHPYDPLGACRASSGSFSSAGPVNPNKNERQMRRSSDQWVRNAEAREMGLKSPPPCWDAAGFENPITDEAAVSPTVPSSHGGPRGTSLHHQRVSQGSPGTWTTASPVDGSFYASSPCLPYFTKPPPLSPNQTASQYYFPTYGTHPTAGTPPPPPGYRMMPGQGGWSRASTVPLGNPWGIDERGPTYRIPIRSTDEAPFPPLSSASSPPAVSPSTFSHHSRQVLSPLSFPNAFSPFVDSSAGTVESLSASEPKDASPPMHRGPTTTPPAGYRGYPESENSNFEYSSFQTHPSLQCAMGSDPDPQGEKTPTSYGKSPISVEHTARKGKSLTSIEVCDPASADNHVQARQLNLDESSKYEEPVRSLGSEEKVARKKKKKSRAERAAVVEEATSKAVLAPAPEPAASLAPEDPAVVPPPPLAGSVIVEVHTVQGKAADSEKEDAEVSGEYVKLLVQLPPEVDREFVCGLGNNSIHCVAVGGASNESESEKRTMEGHAVLDGTDSHVRSLRVHHQTPIGALRELLNVDRSYAIVIEGTMAREEWRTFEYLKVPATTWVSFVKSDRESLRKKRKSVLPSALFMNLIQTDSSEQKSEESERSKFIYEEVIVDENLSRRYNAVDETISFVSAAIVDSPQVALTNDTLPCPTSRGEAVKLEYHITSRTTAVQPKQASLTSGTIETQQAPAGSISPACRRSYTHSPPSPGCSPASHRELMHRTQQEESTSPSIPTQSVGRETQNSSLVQPRESETGRATAFFTDDQKKGKDAPATLDARGTIDINTLEGAADSDSDEWNGLTREGSEGSEGTGTRSTNSGERQNSASCRPGGNRRRERVRRHRHAALSVATAEEEEEAEVAEVMLDDESLEGPQKKKDEASRISIHAVPGLGVLPPTPNHPEPWHTYKRRDSYTEAFKDASHSPFTPIHITIQDPHDSAVLHRNVPVDPQCPVSFLKAWLVRGDRTSIDEEQQAKRLTEDDVGQAQVLYRGERVPIENEYLTFSMVVESLPNGVFSFALP